MLTKVNVAKRFHSLKRNKTTESLFSFRLFRYELVTRIYSIWDVVYRCH